MTPLKAGESVVLNNIFFDFDKATLKPESYVELNKVIDFLNFHTTAKVEISGHTDNYGDDAYNQKLSENRAKAVYDYLVNTGKINPSRLSYKGYGETKPIGPNDTEEGRAKNRRTELKVISI
jgi:outer membrane protein OmpA-like peptidoglycan-associated protein